MKTRLGHGGLGLALAGALAACSPSPWALPSGPLRPSFQLAALSEALRLEPTAIANGVARFEGQGPLGAAGATMALDLPLAEASAYRLAQAGLTVRFVLNGPNFAGPLVVEIRVPAGVRLCSVTIGGLPPGPCTVQVQLLTGTQARPFATTQVTLSPGTTAQPPTLPPLGPAANPVPASPPPSPAPSEAPSLAPSAAPPASSAPPPSGGGGGGGGGGSAPNPPPAGEVEVELSVGEAPASPTPLAPDPAFPELPATQGGL